MRANLLPLAAAVLTGWTAATAAQAPRAVRLDTLGASIAQDRFSSPGALASRLSIPPKGEFETSFEYAKRVAPLLVGAYAVRLPIAPSGLDAVTGCDGLVTYDADAGRLAYRALMDPGAGLALTAFMSCETSVTGSYAATTAMGVKLRVTKAIRDVIEVDAPPDSLFNEAEIELSPAAARSLKPNLRLGLLVVPNGGDGETGVSVRDETEAATLTSPVEIHTRAYVIHAQFVDVFAYDARTGRVVDRASAPRAWDARAARAKQAETDAYDETAVTQRVTPVSSNPVPAYPHARRGDLTVGNVFAQFVVRADGAIDSTTIQLTPTNGADFGSAVRAVLPRWRFAPAMLNGKAVAQRVLMPIFVRPPAP